MSRFRSRLVEIEAVQWTETNIAEVRAFSNRPDSTSNLLVDRRGKVTLWVVKSLAWCDLSAGSWVIAEPDGSGFYPCADEIFKARWEEAK